jgi:hypothetical protein
MDAKSHTSTHTSAASSLYSRNYVLKDNLSLEEFLRKLDISPITSKKTARRRVAPNEGPSFESFWTASDLNWRKTDINRPESVLQKEFNELLQHILPSGRLFTEVERSNEVRSRCDIIISTGDRATATMGRPALFIELKKSGADLRLNEHSNQLVHYAKQLIGRHASVRILPFILFNGLKFFVRYAEWTDYNELEFHLNKREFNIMVK